MEYSEHKTLILTRVPPGDRWSPKDSNLIFESLTEGLEYAYSKTQCRDYHLAALDGKVYTITKEQKAPPPQKTFSLYDE